MRAMAKLRPHVDAFFDKVTVNVADRPDKEKLRENRLKLLNEIRAPPAPSPIFRASKGDSHGVMPSLRLAGYSP